MQTPITRIDSEFLIYETPKHEIQTRTHRNFLHPVRDASLGKTEQRHNTPAFR